MKICVLMTGTNNVPPVIDPLESLGHELTRIIYDEMTYAEHDDIPALVDASDPDWVLLVGAIVEHHGKPVPSTEVLGRVGASHLLCHLCFDGAEVHWWPQLQDYYENGRFALQVNIDGCRKGPIGDRGLTALCPIDVSRYANFPWVERSIWCGFSGGMHSGRPEIVNPLVGRGALVYRPRDDADDYVGYRRFMELCRVGINHATTGGVIGGDHVKFRCLEVAAVGALVLETRGSPLGDWFAPGEDYLEYSGADEAERQIAWVRANPVESEAMARRMREKVAAWHSPAIFWSQVTERLGFGPALVPAIEAPHHHWVPPPAPAAASHASPTANYGEPRLLGTHGSVNIVAMNGHVYTIPWDLGPIELDRVNVATIPRIRQFSDAGAAERWLAGG